jgi:hypothetical protein
MSEIEIKPKRPGVVLAAAIMLFVFGGIAVLGLCGTAFPYLMAGQAQPKKVGNQPNFIDPTPILLTEEPVVTGVLTGFTIFGAILGIAKIWAGVGILQLKPTARKVGIALAILTILVTIAQSVYTALCFFPAYLRIFARENAPEIANFQGLIEGVLWGSTVISIIGSIAVWLTLILLLNSRRARNAFAGISDEPETPEREPRPRYDGYDDEDDYPRSSPSSSEETGITDRPI